MCIEKNEKLLVATFPCSQTPEPWSQLGGGGGRGGVPTSQEPWAGGWGGCKGTK